MIDSVPPVGASPDARASAPAPRRRPRVSASAVRTDALLAGGLLVTGILSAWLGSVAGFYSGEGATIGVSLLCIFALSAPLALRRRYPSVVLLVVAAAFFAAGSLRVPDLYVGQIALFIAVYTVGAWVDDRRRATIVRLLVIVAMFVWLFVSMWLTALEDHPDLPSTTGAFSPFAAYALIQLLVNVAFFGGAYYMGDRAHASALERVVLQERTAELEREREVTAAQAVALDRVRIARELHDVVAHHVSAMGVQAGAARAVLDRDPAAARSSLLLVESSARSALAELRHLLDTLRGPGDDTASDSTVRLAGLADLVAHATANGLPTTLTIVGDPVDLPDVVQVNLFRVAQEALTNARRHGGPDASADVRLRYGVREVELEIADDGRGPVAAGGRPGLGIVGMRERAAASGGTAEIGPRARGGFLVRVRVPVRAEVVA